MLFFNQCSEKGPKNPPLLLFIYFLWTGTPHYVETEAREYHHELSKVRIQVSYLQKSF